MSKLFIVKIGGNVLDDPASLEQFLRDFEAIREPKILVHGGGKIATNIGKKLGIESQYVNGRRITDAETLDLVTMVYGGLVNKQLVATLQSLGCNAIGVTGADGNMMQATKRPVKEINYGFVGDVKPEGVNSSLLSLLLKENTIPVFAPLTHDAGRMLNTNADTIASVLAVALSKHFEVRLIFCFEKKGVLHDVQHDDSVIHHLPRKMYEELLGKNVFADGILPKLENAYEAIYAGVKEVLIGDARDLIQNTGKETAGTLITQ
jgi:acetylglutamate kinase